MNKFPEGRQAMGSGRIVGNGITDTKELRIEDSTLRGDTAS
jgi:hypothetical protein